MKTRLPFLLPLPPCHDTKTLSHHIQHLKFYTPFLFSPSHLMSPHRYDLSPFQSYLIKRRPYGIVTCTRICVCRFRKRSILPGESSTFLHCADIYGNFFVSITLLSTRHRRNWLVSLLKHVRCIFWSYSFLSFSHWESIRYLFVRFCSAWDWACI